ncbi:MAG TPA: CehA/McbA family metallohydrolase [Spirochaetota bacterium]|nr:CehA/McbA family metallohydrolase [Spirochaetota bacterium]
MGHIHNHTTVSGAQGTPEEAYAYARDIAGMDFLGITDHAEEISSREWADLNAAAELFNEDNSFIALRGFEWSSTSNYGHVSIIETADFVRSDDTAADTFNELCAWLSGTNGIAFFNHPGREDDNSTEFSHFTTAPVINFAGMELWNRNDGFSIYYYNDGYVSGDGGMGFYDEALQHGWHIGASGSGDDHRAAWGTAQKFRLAVLAHAKTRDDILAAFRANRFYSTLDRNLAMSFKINGSEMGSTVSAGTYTLEINLDDGSTDDIFTGIDLLRNGIVLNSWSPGEKQVSITQEITVSAGEYYYVRVRQDDGDEAVSSPAWVE